MSEILSVQEAQARIRSTLKPMGLEEVFLQNSAGRTLAENITAPNNLPTFVNSSMDGFAVIASDVAGAKPGVPVTLEVCADIPAGSSENILILAGQAARIMTGAMLPDGADAVVPVEDTTSAPAHFPTSEYPPLPARVSIFRAVQPGDHVRRAGEDVQKGQLLLTQGRRLQPQDLGILAAIGFARVSVFRKPQVALFSTGNELAQPGELLAPGKIYDSNQYVLAAMIERAGADVLRLGAIADDPEKISSMLDYAVNQAVDLIVTSAGVSVGAFDYVRQVIETRGSLNFWKVNMRPGKPLAFGSYAGIPLIGLPGNPVSAYVGCHAFVLPAVAYLAGQTPTRSERRTAFLGESITSDGRESYLRVVVQQVGNKLVAHLTGHQGSGNLFSLVQANALLIVPSGVKSLPLDSEVTIWFLDAE